MFQTAGYPAHPQFFDYRTPPRTPPTTGSYQYYSPRQYVYTATPPKGHARRATQDTTYSYSNTAAYSTPRKSYYQTADYSSPVYYTSAQSTPQHNPDYVSGSPRVYADARCPPRTHAAGGVPHEHRTHSGTKSRSKHIYYSARPQRAYGDYGEEEHECEYLPRYERFEPRPPPYKRRQSYHESRADHRYRDQVPAYTSASAEPKARPRRASYTSAKPTQQPTPPPRRPSTANKPPPTATEEDARRHGIPAGYSTKNWDPTEEPILLLGSVFDANSLGKWIYDWTVFFYGPATPMSEVAGELWLLLIQLAGKIKRAEDCMPRIRQTASRDLVDDFLESGERLWQRFNKLLKICENYMWKAARKESAGVEAASTERKKKKVTMGQNSGCEFVDSIFGRDRELERTEKLMTGMRLWSMRFDANCEEILRNPAA